MGPLRAACMASFALLFGACDRPLPSDVSQRPDAKCGNGVVDKGEVCDDGNLEDRDGCSADCQSDESCGNGFVDEAMGELCDDGNSSDGDGCSADCRSDESCGNGVIDRSLGETCD